ncbi:MAG TPA: ATP-dependent helicase, partial [Pyrodictium sp.]|nr:ATP-dependent helicase [Pyrodictium sp.]
MDSSIEFKVCKWLDDTEFRDLLRFADYKGRDGGCSFFVFSPTKYKRNRLWKEYVVEALERVGAEFDEISRARLEAFFEEEQTVYIYAAKGLGYIIRSHVYLADILQEFREKGDVYYSKDHRGFIVKPYAIIDVIKKLKLSGLKVVDETNLITRRDVIDVELKITLRDYQEEAIEAWITHDGRGVIALPTGAGKTYIGIAAIAHLRLPTLIVVYTREQLHQWLEKLLKTTTLSRSSIGLYYSE